MQAQSFLPGLQSNRAIPQPLNPIPKPNSVALSKLISNSVCLKNEAGVRLRSQRRLVLCKSGIEVEKGETFRVKSELNVGRKRLALFVSGGGSNFRSVYEASLDGCVNGDVVVLVTNKPGELHRGCLIKCLDKLFDE